MDLTAYCGQHFSCDILEILICGQKEKEEKMVESGGNGKNTALEGRTRLKRKNKEKTDQEEGRGREEEGVGRKERGREGKRKEGEGREEGGGRKE